MCVCTFDTCLGYEISGPFTLGAVLQFTIYGLRLVFILSAQVDLAKYCCLVASLLCEEGVQMSNIDFLWWFFEEESCPLSHVVDDILNACSSVCSISIILCAELSSSSASFSCNSQSLHLAQLSSSILPELFVSKDEVNTVPLRSAILRLELRVL